MASYNKFNQFVEDLAHKKHDFSSDTFTVALTNTLPTATDAILTDITEVLYTNCSSRNLVRASSGQTSGTYKIVFNDLTLTASGGNVGPFRYVVVYNDTATNDLLVGWYDYGASNTMVDGSSFEIDMDNVNGMFDLS